MDPRFKTLSFLSDKDRLNVIASVEAEAVMLTVGNTSTSNELTSTEVEVTQESDFLFLKNAKLVRWRNIFLALLMIS